MFNGSARIAIRNHYQAAIDVDFNGRVFANRVKSIWQELIDDGPVFLVYNMDTVHTDTNSAPTMYENTTDLVIQVVMKDNVTGQSIDDRLDLIADYIEAKVLIEPRPDFVEEISLVESNIMLNTETDAVQGAVGLKFNVTYRSEPNIDSNELDDLLSVVNEWRYNDLTVTDTVEFTKGA